MPLVFIFSIFFVFSSSFQIWSFYLALQTQLLQRSSSLLFLKIPWSSSSNIIFNFDTFSSAHAFSLHPLRHPLFLPIWSLYTTLQIHLLRLSNVKPSLCSSSKSPIKILSLHFLPSSYILHHRFKSIIPFSISVWMREASHHGAAKASDGTGALFDFMICIISNNCCSLQLPCIIILYISYIKKYPQKTHHTLIQTNYNVINETYLVGCCHCCLQMCDGSAIAHVAISWIFFVDNGTSIARTVLKIHRLTNVAKVRFLLIIFIFKLKILAAMILPITCSNL